MMKHKTKKECVVRKSFYINEDVFLINPLFHHDFFLPYVKNNC